MIDGPEEAFAAYHAKQAGYGGVAWEFHARAETFIRDQAAEIERLKGELNVRQRSFSEAQKEAVANAQEADQLLEWLADLTEILCGERPIGVMPETTKDAAIKLKLGRAKELARARNEGLERAAEAIAGVGEQMSLRELWRHVRGLKTPEQD